MAWNPIIIDDVKGVVSAAEYSSITTASLPDGKTGTQMVDEVIGNAIAEARGYIAAEASNVLGVEGTAPDELRATLLVIIRYRIFTRLPKMKALLDDLRVKEYDEAMRKLRDVAAGNFKLVQPVTPADPNQQAGGGSVGLVSSSPKRMSRKQMSGLF